MSRMYNQTGNLYKGVFDCLYKTVTTEGVLAIYKGYFAHLARILPHTVRLGPHIRSLVTWLTKTSRS
jgi:solute carrier family 25 protein 34/35